MNFGEKVSKLLKERGETNQELADALGFKSRSHITYYLQREKLPGHEILDKICDHFGITTDYFTEGSSTVRLSQPEQDYALERTQIPILSNETSDAIKIGLSTLSYLDIEDGFIIITDRRLEKQGFPKGSQLFLSTKFDPAAPGNIVLAQFGNEKFFASCEKRKESIFLYPLDKEREPLKLDTSGVSIYATLKYILTKTEFVSLRK